VIGDVSKSLNGINLGRKTNQSFVNVSLGQFTDKLACKLGSRVIRVVMANIDIDFRKKNFTEECKVSLHEDP
jgi:hypothetical protein